MRDRRQQRMLLGALATASCLGLFAAHLGRPREDGASRPGVQGPAGAEDTSRLELDPDRASASLAASPGAARVVADAEAPESAFGPSVLVLTVDEHDVPLAGSAIRILEGGFDSDTSPPWTAADLDPVGTIERLGRPFTTDAYGRVRLPWSAATRRILARHEGRSALAVFDSSSSSPWVIRLEREWKVSVFVHDESGTAMSGLPLEVRDAADGSVQFRLCSDGTGHASFDSLLASQHDLPYMLSITACVPAEPPAEVWIQSGTPGKGTLDLLVPSGSRTTLRVLDERGRIVALDAQAWIELPRRRLARWTEYGHVHVPIRGGLGELRSIPAGVTELVVDGQPIRALPDGSWPEYSDLGLGQDCRAIPVVVEAGHTPSARRTLIRTLGVPGLVEDWLESDLARFQTDDRGSYLEIRDLSEEHVEPREWVYEVFDDSADPPLAGRLSFDEFLTQAESGSVHVALEPVPVAVSGIVLDARGEPAASVEVSRRLLLESGELSAPLPAYGPSRSGPDGRFVLHDLPRPGTFALTAEREWDLDVLDSERTRHAWGTRDLIVRVAIGGTVEGSITTEERDRARDLRVEVRAEDGESTTCETWTDGVRRRFRSYGLPAGTYELQVFLDEGDDPVVHLAGVVVPECGTVQDPRLHPIDLRGLVPEAPPPTIESPTMLWTLRIVDLQGQPIEHGTWRIRDDGSWGGLQPWAEGTIRAETRPDWIEVRAPGHFSRSGAVAGGEGFWELPEPQDLELRLTSMPEGWPGRVQLSVSLQPSNMGSSQEQSASELDARCRCRWQVYDEDSWSARLCARWMRDEELQSVDLLSFTVRPRAGTPVQTLEIPWRAEWERRLMDEGAPVPSRR